MSEKNLLRGDHDLQGCPFRKKADCCFCASQEHHYLLCPGGNEVIVVAAAAGKATRPKPIPDDKGGAPTIHGNVGMVSGHKVSVKKVGSGLKLTSGSCRHFPCGKGLVVQACSWIISGSLRTSLR